MTLTNEDLAEAVSKVSQQHETVLNEVELYLFDHDFNALLSHPTKAEIEKANAAIETLKYIKDVLE